MPKPPPRGQRHAGGIAVNGRALVAPTSVQSAIALIDEATRAERLGLLDGLTPRRMNPDVAEFLRPLLLELVVNTPHESRPRHIYRQFLGVAFCIAEWDLAQHGDLDLRRAFSDVSIESFLAQHYGPGASSGTLGSIRSKLVTIRSSNWPDLDRPAATYGRRSVCAPYMPAQILGLRRRADTLPAALAAEWLVLLALTIGAGARSNELVTLPASAVRTIPAGTVVDLVNLRGAIRPVPVAGWAENVLLARAGQREPDAPLVGSASASRLRVTCKINAVHRRFPHEPRFSLARARMTFLLHLLESDVSFVRVAAIADIGLGSHTPGDLLAYSQADRDLNRAVWNAVAR